MSIASNASEITLPAVNKGWQTVLQFLCSQFPFIEESVWRQRMRSGKVHWFNGDTVHEQTPFSASKRLCYYREVADEPVIPFAHYIVYQDEHILVADKPHFLPVTPGGDFVNECLLERLKQQTGIADLVAVHRLDRETAGLVLFSVSSDNRAAYYEMFRAGTVQKHYQAVAMLTDEMSHAPLPQRWQIENRIEKAQPRFINRMVAGEPNTRSSIVLQQRKQQSGLFSLTPYTGKTHQLRLHMLSLGMPILHDKYYPELLPKQPAKFDKPLQLLAKSLSFTDPFSGLAHRFESTFQLSAWAAG